MKIINFTDFVTNLPTILKDKYIEELVAYYKRCFGSQDNYIFETNKNEENSIIYYVNKISWGLSIYGSNLWSNIARNHSNLEINIDFVTKKQIFYINLHSYILRDAVYTDLIQRINDLGISNVDIDEFPQRVATSSDIVLLDWNKT
jgi:hypothetical protein